MEVKNPKYAHQGIHVIASIFTIEKGKLKILLVKRKNNPYQGHWALTGGALYNDEDLEDGLNREIYEKTGLEHIEVKLANVFGKKNRSPVMRMVAVTYFFSMSFSFLLLFFAFYIPPIIVSTTFK